MNQYGYSKLGFRMIAFSYIITLVSVISLSLHHALSGFYYIIGWVYLIFGLYLSKQSLSKYFLRLLGKKKMTKY